MPRAIISSTISRRARSTASSQVLPTGYMNNDAWAGSAGGTVAANDNSITQVSLGDGVNAVSYNFCDVKPASLAGTCRRLLDRHSRWPA